MIEDIQSINEIGLMIDWINELTKLPALIIELLQNFVQNEASKPKMRIGW